MLSEQYYTDTCIIIYSDNPNYKYHLGLELGKKDTNLEYRKCIIDCIVNPEKYTKIQIEQFKIHRIFDAIYDMVFKPRKPEPYTFFYRDIIIYNINDMIKKMINYIPAYTETIPNYLSLLNGVPECIRRIPFDMLLVRNEYMFAYYINHQLIPNMESLMNNLLDKGDLTFLPRILSILLTNNIIPKKSNEVFKIMMEYMHFSFFIDGLSKYKFKLDKHDLINLYSLPLTENNVMFILTYYSPLIDSEMFVKYLERFEAFTGKSILNSLNTNPEIYQALNNPNQIRYSLDVLKRELRKIVKNKYKHLDFKISSFYMCGTYDFPSIDGNDVNRFIDKYHNEFSEFLKELGFTFYNNIVPKYSMFTLI